MPKLLASTIIDGIPNWAFYAILGVLIAIVVILPLVLLIVRRLKETPAKKKEAAKPKGEEDALIPLLGGKENIVSHASMGSRLTINLKDSSLVDGEGLKEKGFPSYILGKGKITLVIDGGAKALEDSLFAEDVEG